MLFHELKHYLCILWLAYTDTSYSAHLQFNIHVLMHIIKSLNVQTDYHGHAVPGIHPIWMDSKNHCCAQARAYLRHPSSLSMVSTICP